MAVRTAVLGVVALTAAVLAGCAGPAADVAGGAGPPAPGDVGFAPTTSASAPVTSTVPTPPVSVLPTQGTTAAPTLLADPPPVPLDYPPPVSRPDPVLPQLTVPSAPPPGPVPAELQAAADDAVRVVDGYWERHWGEIFSGTYARPTLVGLYDGAAATGPTCAGQRLPPNNATYCVPEDSLAWDVTLIGLQSQIGASWPYLVVAHEWGHAIQARLAATLTDKALELQADCLAGATLYGAVADGTLVLGETAATEIATALAAAADETQWTDVRDHGNAAERTGAFDTGRTGGVRACLPPG